MDEHREWCRNSLGVVHVLDRLIGLSLALEAHKAEATAASSIAVLDHYLYLVNARNDCYAGHATHSLLDNTKFFKLGAEGGVISVPREATVMISTGAI